MAAWSAAARKLAADPAFQATIAKQSLTLAIADTPEFTAAIARQNEAFTTLIPKLGIKP
jgi:tripartite-type tricarboxylate transporter receptor subunit TctC